jgi:hypothetical protein
MILGTLMEMQRSITVEGKSDEVQCLGKCYTPSYERKIDLRTCESALQKLNAKNLDWT